MYQAVKRFWEKLDENSKSECDWYNYLANLKNLD